jgi:hypothetical protein
MARDARCSFARASAAPPTTVIRRPCAQLRSRTGGSSTPQLFVSIIDAPGYWIPGQAGDDVGMRIRDLAASCARVFANSATLKRGRRRSQEGRREDRVRAAPAISRAKAVKKGAHEHTGSAEAVRPSLRNGFTAYNVISPVIGFLATVAPEKLASQELDASVEASGPHDFAVRVTRCSSKAHPRPPHPRQRS